MISNATRACCAVLSTIGTAGLVVFATPTTAIGAGHPAPAPAVAAVALGAPARG